MPLPDRVRHNLGGEERRRRRVLPPITWFKEVCVAHAPIAGEAVSVSATHHVDPAATSGCALADGRRRLWRHAGCRGRPCSSWTRQRVEVFQLGMRKFRRSPQVKVLSSTTSISSRCSSK